MKILKLNSISPIAEKALGSGYELSDKADSPDGIILRSFDMHGYPLPESVLCVSRAGAGVNNIPVNELTEKGVVVFNTPGANANAVKELALCALILCGRDIIGGINWCATLSGGDVAKQVESGKKAFIGSELSGKTLGVIGLGAIGALVANAAADLGMNVVGYDPYVSVESARNLDSRVRREENIDKLFAESDFITLHLPLTQSTKGIINEKSLSLMKDGVGIVNCSRGELVDNAAILASIDGGKVARYATDFPTEELLNKKNVIAIPHLGASTPEAEDNCALMAARQMADFLENGNITNSVNFPACKLDRNGVQRLTVIHRNVKNALSAVTELINKSGINVNGFVNNSKGDYAFAVFDLDKVLSDESIEKLGRLNDVIRVRVL